MWVSFISVRNVLFVMWLCRGGVVLVWFMFGFFVWCVFCEIRYKG